MTFPRLHRWPRTPAAAIALQRRIASAVVLRPLPANVRWIAAADVAFSRDGKSVIAGVVLWDARERIVVERRVARRPATFPYVPGLLSFREIPAVLAALARLRGEAEVVLCDGQGLAHPRRCGLACHLGLWLGIPTVGVAKSRLCGEHDEPGRLRGARTPLCVDGAAVGSVLRTRTDVRPLYISPGHLCDIDTAVAITLETSARYRLPDPAREAHALVTREKQRTPAAPARGN